MREVVIVEAVRTAVGKKNGTLAQTHPTDLLGPVQMEALRRAGITPDQVGQIVGGCIDQVGAQAANIARTAWLAYGGPITTGAMTVDTQCGSSQHSVTLGRNLIASGAEDIVLCCGVENMSMVPLGSNALDGHKAGHGSPWTRRYRENHEFTSQFEGAERMATKYGVTREEADAFGLESQRRARQAIAEGRFETQILPVTVNVVNENGEKTGETKVFDRDEIPRDTSMEALAKLKPVAREDGIHTAGSASQIADGAAAVLLMSAEKAKELGLKPKARLLQTELVGCDPVLMLEGPIPATQKMLAKQGITMADIDVVEINEAFASVVLSWAKEVDADMSKVNVNGGAIALGHPLGGTGCVLVTKAVHELERSGGKLGLVTMCCGGGLGTGTLIERID